MTTSRQCRRQSQRRQFLLKRAAFAFFLCLAAFLLTSNTHHAVAKQCVRRRCLERHLRVGASVWRAHGRCERTLEKNPTAIAFAVSTAAVWSISARFRRVQSACNEQTRNATTIKSSKQPTSSQFAAASLKRLAANIRISAIKSVFRTKNL